MTSPPRPTSPPLCLSPSSSEATDAADLAQQDFLTQQDSAETSTSRSSPLSCATSQQPPVKLILRLSPDAHSEVWMPKFRPTRRSIKGKALEYLSRAFKKNDKPSRKQRIKFGHKLGLSQQAIYNWFARNRNRIKEGRQEVKVA